MDDLNCSDTCAPHLHMYCSPECEATAAGSGEPLAQVGSIFGETVNNIGGGIK